MLWNYPRYVFVNFCKSLLIQLSNLFVASE